MLAAWMLPNDGPLTDPQRRQAMDNFRTYISVRGIRVGDVARKIGNPRGTTINELIQYKWRQGSDEHIRKLNDWVEQHAHAAQVKFDAPYISTFVAVAIRDIAQLVRENVTMGLAMGPSGIGKSRCAQAVYETTPGAVYHRVITESRTPRGLIGHLAQALGVRQQPDYKMTNTIFERVIGTLKGSGRLLLIDEAHKLNADGLELLRDVHDSASVPILLLCTKDLHDRLLRDSTPDRGQLYSRFGVIYHLTQPPEGKDDDKHRFTVQQIRELYERTPIRLAADAAAYLRDVANDFGNGSLRRCGDIIRNGVRRSRYRNNCPGGPVTVTAADLRYAEALLRNERYEQQSVASRLERAAVSA